MEEPSLLDYLKAKLSGRDLAIEPEDSIEPVIVPEELSEEPAAPKEFFLTKIPWRSLIAFSLAFYAQLSLQNAPLNPKLGIILYAASGLMLVYALLKNEWQIQPHRLPDEKSIDLGIRRVPLFFFIPFLFVSFLAFSGNRFTSLNVVLWIVTLVSGLLTFWVPEKKTDWVAVRTKITGFFKNPIVSFKFDYWKVLVLAVFLISAWFHLSQLNTIPYSMTSDHTEKLLDVNSILNGQYSIFFANNGGREPIHFYLIAFFIKVFNTGLNFFTLKLTMALAFLLSLIYVYKLGNEIGNRWTGLFAMLLIGFASWDNMIARVGLRLVLAPAFAAPVLYYLFRGIRQARRNDFILAGILLGLGLLGYSAFRIMPFVVVAGVIIYLAHQKFSKTTRNVWWALGLLSLFALVLFLPLLRFAIEYPEAIGLRTLTRMTSAEVALPGNVAKIFLSNFWNAITMPFWKDGSTWVISIPGRPALDVFSAGLYFLGLVLLLYRWIRTRAWQDLFLLISVPLLMLPSILSLAFPDENPSLSRAGGATVPIFLISAIGLETLLSSLWARASRGFSRSLVVAIGVIVFAFSAVQNYDIAMKKYPEQYANSTWNTAQMGEVARNFIATTGNPNNVWVVGVPYWVDTRLVAMSAGYIDRDYAIWPQDIETTIAITGTKLFLVKFDDQIGLERLNAIYPQGFSIYHSSTIEGRDFIAYIVPPAGDTQ